VKQMNQKAEMKKMEIIHRRRGIRKYMIMKYDISRDKYLFRV